MSRLLTADEVAARLGVPKSWVWARARANEIPCVPFGRYRRFREDALEIWIRDLEQAGVPFEQAGFTRPGRGSSWLRCDAAWATCATTSGSTRSPTASQAEIVIVG